MANYKVYFIIYFFNEDVCKEDKYTNIMLKSKFRELPLLPYANGTEFKVF
jgi:hypothetical protein